MVWAMFVWLLHVLLDGLSWALSRLPLGQARFYSNRKRSAQQLKHTEVYHQSPNQQQSQQVAAVVQTNPPIAAAYSPSEVLRCFEQPGPYYLLARTMKPVDIDKALLSYDTAHARIYSCSYLLHGCPMKLYELTGVLHMVKEEVITRVDTQDSHTPYSGDLQSVGQDNRFQVDDIKALEAHMLSKFESTESWQVYNEVSALLNCSSVVRLLYSTDVVKRAFDVSVGDKAAQSLTAATAHIELPIYEWQARDGVLKHIR